MKAGKGHAVIEERQAKQGMRARQCMKMKKSKDAGAWASNSYICIERSTCRKWGLWSKGKPCLGSHALMPTEEYLVFGVSFFGASNSHHTHHARATRANCASPHKQAKQISMLPATHFGATSVQPKQLSGAFLFAAGQALEFSRLLSAPLR